MHISVVSPVYKAELLVDELLKRVIENVSLITDNYEIILQWNRSLRFSLAVCTLKEKFKNAL